MNNDLQLVCPTCGCKQLAPEGVEQFNCRLCGTFMTVTNRVAVSEIKNEGVISVIKYEGNNDVFVWKHPVEDFNLGTQLIVHETQQAVFFRDGKVLDIFGAGRHTLLTQNLPLLERLYKIPTNSDELFHSEVYFVNMTTQMGIKWGTDSKIRLFDPASGLYVELGASGNFNIQVSDSRKVITRLVGTTEKLTQPEIIGAEGYGISQMTGKFKALIMNSVKTNLAQIIKMHNINVLEIDMYLELISEQMRGVINETLVEYGLVMPEFYVTTIVTPDDDPNFKRLKQQFADKTLRVREEEIRKAEAEAAQGRKLVEAETDAKIKMVSAQGEAAATKIRAQGEADAYKMQAMAEAEEMRAKGYTYQQETARQVGMEAMQNGIVGEGSASSGIGELAGLGVALGTMGSVAGMAKDVLNPILDTTSTVATGVAQTITSNVEAWDCTCGIKGNTMSFCPNCGTKKPEKKVDGTWNCICGTTGNTMGFCPNCGAKRP